MNALESVTAERDTALEMVRQLQERLKLLAEPVTWADYRGLCLGRAERFLLNAIYEHVAPIPYEKLHALIDAKNSQITIANRQSLRVRICQLRQKLMKLDPPVNIVTQRSVGPMLLENDRARLAERRIELRKGTDG